MHFRRISLIVGAILIPVTSSVAVKAQAPVIIKLHCKVPGYSSGSGWVRIENGGPGGGRVVRDGKDMITDRVARGEKFRVSIDDPSFTKKCKCEFTLEARVTSKNKKVFQGELTIPFQREFDIPTDPNFDSVLVEIFDPIAPKGVVTRRIPIGMRPK